MESINTFNDSLKEAGHWIFAWGLHGPEESRVIDNRNGAGVIALESLIKSPENYSGFWLIEADSMETAEKLALASSKACNRKVELRQLH
jgi:hypothetical protein